LGLAIEKINYLNDGKELVFRCDSYEISLYDKTKELETQNIFFDCNVLRIEVRFKKETT
jgi:hypothetical protein